MRRFVAMLLLSVALAASLNVSASGVVPSSSAVEQAGEARLPGSPASHHSPCFDTHHHSCAPAAVSPAQAEAVMSDTVRGAIAVPAQSPALLAVRFDAPPPAASFSILFRNFRE
jgi:hypothetical protein